VQVPTATPEHQFLTQFIGEWTYSTKYLMGPNQPPMIMNGTETVRGVGDLWTLAEGKNEHGTSIMTLGFDTKLNKFVGTFIASMMTNIWHYQGTLDATGKVLALDARGPSMMDPNNDADYVDTIEAVDANTRTLKSKVKTPDGTWVEFMWATYTRKD
jgi:Protein of unknown function (DUF1579)